MRHLFVLLLLGTPAYARVTERDAGEALAPTRQATVIVDRADNKHVTIASATADAVETADVAIVTLDLRVVATDGVQTGKLTLTLPHDASVVALSFDQGASSVARPLQTREGRRQFEADQAIGIDPALLEWTRTTGDTDRLQLSLFPIPTSGATAKLTITMPRFKKLVVANGTHREQLAGPFASASAEEALLAKTARVVRRDQSLYVAPQLPNRTPEEITTYVATSRPALRACFTGDRPRDVVLKFTIDEAGAVVDSSVQGGSEFSDCVGGVVGKWKFFRAREAMTVSYPLHFVPK